MIRQARPIVHLALTIGFLLVIGGSSASAQKVVDRTLAIVSDNSGRPELITYSDILWQMALEAGTDLRNPNKDDVTRVLETVVRQRLFILEANRLPQAPPTEAEINAELRDVLEQFPTVQEFESRLRAVGFDSVKDANFERLMTERVKIKKYINFRFRSFVVITPEDEERYLNEVVIPEFRRRFPNAAEPKLADQRARINSILVERSVAQSIEAFFDEAERNTEIIYLNDN